MTHSSTFPRSTCATPGCHEKRLPGSHFGIKCIGPVRTSSGKPLSVSTEELAARNANLRAWLADEPERLRKRLNAHRVPR